MSAGAEQDGVQARRVHQAVRLLQQHQHGQGSRCIRVQSLQDATRADEQVRLPNTPCQPGWDDILLQQALLYVAQGRSVTLATDDAFLQLKATGCDGLALGGRELLA